MRERVRQQSRGTRLASSLPAATAKRVAGRQVGTGVGQHDGVGIRREHRPGVLRSHNDPGDGDGDGIAAAML